MTSLGDRILQRQTECLTYIFALWHWRIPTCVRIWSSHTGNKGDTLRMLWQATTLWRQQETLQEYQWHLGSDYQLTFCIWLETFSRITLDSLEVLQNYLCIYTEIGQFLCVYVIYQNVPGSKWQLLSNVLTRVGKTSEMVVNWNNSRPWIGLFQGAKCENVPKCNLELAWGESVVVVVTPVHLFIFLFFPPNFCALLVLDRGHQWVPVIHEDAWRYLNL